MQKGAAQEMGYRMSGFLRMVDRFHKQADLLAKLRRLRFQFAHETVASIDMKLDFQLWRVEISQRLSFRVGQKIDYASAHARATYTGDKDGTDPGTAGAFQLDPVVVGNRRRVGWGRRGSGSD